jgi:hypothetical protein
VDFEFAFVDFEFAFVDFEFAFVDFEFAFVDFEFALHLIQTLKSSVSAAAGKEFAKTHREKRSSRRCYSKLPCRIVEGLRDTAMITFNRFIILPLWRVQAKTFWADVSL